MNPHPALANAFKTGGFDNRRAMQALVRSFPSLRDYPYTDWNPKRFQRWALGPRRHDGLLHAARFVLSVWNPTIIWRIGRFDVVTAMSVWDSPHRAAFAAWAKDPWWP